MSDIVLIAEDDAGIVDILSLYIGDSGFEIRTAQNGKAALEILRTEPVSIALVDIMMPGMSGYELIREARSFTDIPIIIVSARTQAADKIIGLDAGADGYVTKPFDPLEVTAYIRAMLRRHARQPSAASAAEAPEGGLLTVGSLSFDAERLLLRKGGEVMPLTAAELKIMHALMRAPGRVFTKAQLYEAATGEPCVGGEGSVMVHISNIRAKLDNPDAPSCIETVRGLGYRLGV